MKGGRAAGEKLLENLELTSVVVHVGDIRTSVLHPASTTHRQLRRRSDRCRYRSGLIRASVGVEDIEDIIADFDQALNKTLKHKTQDSCSRIAISGSPSKLQITEPKGELKCQL